MVADLSVEPPGRPEVDVEPAALDDFDEHQGDELGVVAQVTETQVRSILDGAGRAAAVSPLNAGVPGLWRFTDAELDDLTPPLTRIINKRPAVARLVEKGDEGLVALQLAAYLGRNVDELTEHRRQRRQEASDGLAGEAEPAAPGTGGVAPEPAGGRWPHGSHGVGLGGAPG